VLSLAEREEISRGLAAGRSIRTIAALLGRAPSTVTVIVRSPRWWSGSAKAKALALESVDRLLAEVRAAGTHPALVYCLKRYPSFCLVMRETPTGALLMPIPSEATSSDGQAGYVLPVLDGRLNYQTPDRGVFRAIRTERDGDVSYWGGGDLYSPWGGQAFGFDFWD